MGFFQVINVVPALAAIAGVLPRVSRGLGNIVRHNGEEQGHKNIIYTKFIKKQRQI